MRDRLFRFAAASAVVAVIAWCPKIQAQQENRQAGVGHTQTQTTRQEANRTTGETETIRGVVAAITAEGEAMLDYRTNTAARTEAAFLTIVGSPVGSWGSEPAARASATDRTGTDRAGADSMQRKRHNVYVAWLTPRTKVCEVTDMRGEDQKRETNAGNANANASATAGGSSAKEVALDQLEVGDHVEIKFSKTDESATNNGVHQTQQMRQKHGRHRTFVGYATELKILPSNYEHSSSASTGTASDRSK
jgi:hypothetical protein